MYTGDIVFLCCETGETRTGQTCSLGKGVRNVHRILSEKIEYVTTFSAHVGLAEVIVLFTIPLLPSKHPAATIVIVGDLNPQTVKLRWMLEKFHF
jgi:hypothetical protein